MQKSELLIAINWARQEGWNPGLQDAESFYHADPEGFFIGLLDGEPIATGAAVAYDKVFGFCGLYIVKPEFRNQGYGMKLTEERLKYLGGRTIGLDGVLDKVSKYQRIGYVPAHINRRYVLKNIPLSTEGNNIKELHDIPFKQVEALDRRYFPSVRTSFLRAWIGQATSFSLGFVEEEKLKGYGVIRECYEGCKIGPLFAENLSIAKSLFASLCAKMNKGPIYLDVPEPNLHAQELIKEYQMEPVFEVLRMYRNGIPQIDLKGVYGITSYELG